MKFLIVDDSRAARMLVLKTLREAGFSGHPMREAANGEDALTLLKSEAFDVVLCDWNMPRMTGLDLLLAIRQESIEVRFGFVTAETSAAIRAQAEAAGAIFFLTKPFTVWAFAEALTPLLAA
jgi:two-component system, chemotaxis family, chemotaxis protein CheY